MSPNSWVKSHSALPTTQEVHTEKIIKTKKKFLNFSFLKHQVEKM